MADTAENFRTFLLTDATITSLVGTRVFQNSVPQAKDLPYIWFTRRRVAYLEVLGETGATPYQEFFDVECVDDDVDGAIDLAEAVRAQVNGHSGTMGTATYQWVNVQDQFEDYVPRNLDADEFLSIASLNVEVINQ